MSHIVRCCCSMSELIQRRQDELNQVVTNAFTQFAGRGQGNEHTNRLRRRRALAGSKADIKTTPNKDLPQYFVSSRLSLKGFLRFCCTFDADKVRRLSSQQRAPSCLCSCWLVFRSWSSICWLVTLPRRAAQRTRLPRASTARLH